MYPGSCVRDPIEHMLLLVGFVARDVGEWLVRKARKLFRAALADFFGLVYRPFHANKQNFAGETTLVQLHSDHGARDGIIA